MSSLPASDVAEACAWVGAEGSGRQLLVNKVENRMYMSTMQRRLNDLERAGTLLFGT